MIELKSTRIAEAAPLPSAQLTQKIDDGPKIDSVNELYSWGECSGTTATTDGMDTIEFTFSYVCFIDDDNAAYYGNTSQNASNLTVQALRECLKRVPDDELFPKTPMNTNITIFSLPRTKDLYAKYPDLPSWDIFKGQNYLPRLFLGEVEAFELLHRNPHPNIVRYYGCTVNRNRITSIIMDRHPITLEKRLEENGCDDFDTKSFAKAIGSAIRHLHSLGLAHNDLKPDNIMLDKNGRPILIDFASCKPFGSHLMECGTRGWTDEKYHISEKQHDETALRKIFAWIEEKMSL